VPLYRGLIPAANNFSAAPYTCISITLKNNS
jgi:hypothetical protein